MTDQLIALRLPPRRIGEWLRRAWDDGDAVLPLSTDASGEELARTLEGLRPARLVRLEADGREAVDELESPAEVTEGVALVVATSGSTGEPKGAVLSHDAVSASTGAGIERLGCRRGEPWLCCLPTHHVAGLQTLLRSWALGAAPLVHDRFEVDALAAADAAHVSLVPTQLSRLLEAGVDLSRFATVLLGGARAEPDLVARARGTGARVVESYGMTETCGGCVYDGLPLDGVEVGLRRDGRIRVRGAVRFSGYRALPERPPPAIDGEGWFTTGDVGRFSEGRLEVLGRADDVIVCGGENVPLAAATAAVRSHPAVLDAATLGRDDAEWGQVVVAAVVLRAGVPPPSLAELRDFVRARHPAAFVPREVTVVRTLPRDRMGKVPRGVLEDLLGAE